MPRLGLALFLAVLGVFLWSTAHADPVCCCRSSTVEKDRHHLLQPKNVDDCASFPQPSPQAETDPVAWAECGRTGDRITILDEIPAEIALINECNRAGVRAGFLRLPPTSWKTVVVDSAKKCVPDSKYTDRSSTFSAPDMLSAAAKGSGTVGAMAVGAAIGTGGAALAAIPILVVGNLIYDIATGKWQPRPASAEITRADVADAASDFFMPSVKTASSAFGGPMIGMAVSAAGAFATDAAKDKDLKETGKKFAKKQVVSSFVGAAASAVGAPPVLKGALTSIASRALDASQRRDPYEEDRKEPPPPPPRSDPSARAASASASSRPASARPAPSYPSAASMRPTPSAAPLSPLHRREKSKMPPSSDPSARAAAPAPLHLTRRPRYDPSARAAASPAPAPAPQPLVLLPAKKKEDPSEDPKKKCNDRSCSFFSLW